MNEVPDFGRWIGVGATRQVGGLPCPCVKQRQRGRHEPRGAGYSVAGLQPNPGRWADGLLLVVKAVLCVAAVRQSRILQLRVPHVQITVDYHVLGPR